MTNVSQTFQSAPMGRRVIWAAVFVGLITSLVAAVNIAAIMREGLYSKRAGPYGVNLILPCLPLLAAIPSFYVARARVSHFSVQDSVLVLGRKRYPLAGLTEVRRDPEVLSKARKVWGNGGLGAILGTFRSKRVGKFEAFLTDPDYAVVLTWPDRVVAVSPADPEYFIHVAREAAGLR